MCVECFGLFAGTPATMTQMAKDVCTFLRWASGELARCVVSWQGVW